MFRRRNGRLGSNLPNTLQILNLTFLEELIRVDLLVGQNGGIYHTVPLAAEMR